MAKKKKKKLKKKQPQSFGDCKSKLCNVYKDIPCTKGCMENINKPGGCRAWCCNIQSPQALFVEFVNAWEHVLRFWMKRDMTSLVRRALTTYVSNQPTKGCVFWDKESKLCGIHEARPLSCRTYGIEPDEEFKPRFERMQQTYGHLPGAIVRYQCQLVSTENDEPVALGKCDEWWGKAVDIEKAFGVKEKDIHDRFGGTYRTFHDHLLAHLYPITVMQDLSKIRVEGSPDEKEIVVGKLIGYFNERMFAVVQGEANAEAEASQGT